MNAHHFSFTLHGSLDTLSQYESLFFSLLSQPCPIKASLSGILITDSLLSCCTIIINIYKDDPDSTKKDQDLKIGHTSFVHINQNNLFSVYIRKYNLFFLNSRSAVFRLSPHLSSCEICAQKDNRQDKIFSRQYLFCRVHP